MNQSFLFVLFILAAFTAGCSGTPATVKVWSTEEQTDFREECAWSYNNVPYDAAYRTCACMFGVIANRWGADDFNRNSVSYLNQLESEGWIDACERQGGLR